MIIVIIIIIFSVSVNMFESEGYCGTSQLVVLTVTQILATQLDPRVSLKKKTIPFQFLVVVPSQGPNYLNKHYRTAIRKIIVKVRVKRGKKKQISIEEYKGIQNNWGNKPI